MRFSLIVPVYNRPDEVEELLQSCTQQTNKDFEVIIVEDGSSRKCDEVYDIISEELQPFYEGQKNVDEVCEIIQSRCSIFLKEKQ